VCLLDAPRDLGEAQTLSEALCLVFRRRGGSIARMAPGTSVALSMTADADGPLEPQ
jgi:hypothetical protein